MTVSPLSKAEMKAGPAGFIYVVDTGVGPLKLGKTTNINVRMKAYRTSTGPYARLLAAAWVSDRHQAERAVKHHFAHFRLGQSELCDIPDSVAVKFVTSLT